MNFNDSYWQAPLRSRMRREGTRRAYAADFFTFRKGMYPKFPRLLLGRSYFDNGMIYETRRLGLPVINATGRVTAIHQNHFYTALPGETVQSHAGTEAAENFKTIGGWDRMYWMYDSTHRLTFLGLFPDLPGRFLLRRRMQSLWRSTRRFIVRVLATLGLRDKPYYAK